MKLTKFNYPTLQRRADKFLKSLMNYLELNPELKPFILNHPIDHLAIKADTSEDYQIFVNSVKRYSNHLSSTPMDNRNIATALLKKPIIFKQLGESQVLEIIEPKPEKAGTSGARFDHIEIFNPNFENIESVLKKMNIPYQPYKNPKHKALVVVINNLQQEIKFTDGNLKQIVLQEIDEGTAAEL